MSRYRQMPRSYGALVCGAVLAILGGSCDLGGFPFGIGRCSAQGSPDVPANLTNRSRQVVHVRVTGYIDEREQESASEGPSQVLAPGESLALTPGESLALRFGGKPVRSGSFLFSVTTAMGHSTRWQAKASSDVATITDQMLETHARLATQRGREGPLAPCIFVGRVPKGGRLKVNSWVVSLKNQVGFYQVEPDAQGQGPRVTVQIECDSSGNVIAEKREITLTPYRVISWDGSDVASPNKSLRTARYLQELDRIIDASTAANGSASLGALALSERLMVCVREIDDLVARGVDEEVVQFSVEQAEQLAALAKQMKSGEVAATTWDDRKQELRTRIRRLEKLLTARLGDEFSVAMMNPAFLPNLADAAPAAEPNKLVAPTGATPASEPNPDLLLKSMRESRRRGVEKQILDVERYIQQTQEKLAKAKSRFESLDKDIKQKRDQAKSAKLDTKKTIAFEVLITPLEYSRNTAKKEMAEAETSLTRYQNQLLQLKKELVDLQ